METNTETAMQSIQTVLIFQHEGQQKNIKIETRPPSEIRYAEVDMRIGKEPELPEGRLPGIVIFNCDQFDFTTMLKVLQFKSKLNPATLTLLFAPYSINALEFAAKTGMSEFISQPVSNELLQTIVQRLLAADLLWDF